MAFIFFGGTAIRITLPPRHRTPGGQPSGKPTQTTQGVMMTSVSDLYFRHMTPPTAGRGGVVNGQNALETNFAMLQKKQIFMFAVCGGL